MSSQHTCALVRQGFYVFVRTGRNEHRHEKKIDLPHSLGHLENNSRTQVILYIAHLKSFENVFIKTHFSLQGAVLCHLMFVKKKKIICFSFWSYDVIK